MNNRITDITGTKYPIIQGEFLFYILKAEHSSTFFSNRVLLPKVECTTLDMHRWQLQFLMPVDLALLPR